MIGRILRAVIESVLLLLVLASLLIALLLPWYWPRHEFLPAQASPWQVVRLADEPLIADMGEELGYVNINGPTVIEVPDWIANPLGRYYLYFAHHKGSYIRLAYSESPLGPWTVHDDGALSLADSGLPTSLPSDDGGFASLSALWQTFELPVVRDYLILLWDVVVAGPAERRARGMSEAANRAVHIASPEIVIDEHNERLLLFFHGLDARGSQSSRVAESVDGLHFHDLGKEVFSTYLRHFEHGGMHYLLGMPGVLYRSPSLLGPWVPRGEILFEPNMRHAGLLLRDDTLYVFWSRVGDAPERILLSQIDLTDPDWQAWQATEPVEVMRAEHYWEGAELPALPSLRGELDILANELRDPFVLEDSAGNLYLYYVGGGEQGIGVVRLMEN